MTRSAQVQRVIAVWGLDGQDERDVRWSPPESFLAEHAAFGIAPIRREADAWEGQPDFVREHPEFFARRARPRTRLPPLAAHDIASLEKIGTPAGPSVSEAVSLLRRARRSRLDLVAAHAVLGAVGDVPEPVRIECAYLFAL